MLPVTAKQLQEKNSLKTFFPSLAMRRSLLRVNNAPKIERKNFRQLIFELFGDGRPKVFEPVSWKFSTFHILRRDIS